MPWALVNDEVELQKFSQVAVPTMLAPVSRTLDTMVASVFGVQAGNASLPKDCGTSATAIQSLMHTVLAFRIGVLLAVSPSIRKR